MGPGQKDATDQVVCSQPGLKLAVRKFQTEALPVLFMRQCHLTLRCSATAAVDRECLRGAVVGSKQEDPREPDEALAALAHVNSPASEPDLLSGDDG